MQNKYLGIDVLPNQNHFGSRLLIVDDNQANVKLLEKLLIQEGYNSIQSTTDSREAVSLYREFCPHLVLLDLRMPYIDGFEIMQHLQEIEKDSYIPVLVLTAEGDRATRLKALEAGAKDFLTKPFDTVEVEYRIRNMLEVRLLHSKIKEQNESLEGKIKERTNELRETQLSVVRRLGQAAEYRDNDTGNHVIRMSRFSALLAKQLGASSEQCELLLHASPMHDVGKIGIPDRILLKKGKLDPEEWKTMQTHVTIGSEILSDDKSELIQLAQKITLQHHEKWDGSGYPYGLKGEDISFEARIVTVCDVFDALTSERPYKKAWSVEDALTEIEKQSGTSFDQKVVKKFKSVLPEIIEVKNSLPD
jgi:putative two-component system response regulator